MDQLCAVCGDKASGTHYDARSCYRCKDFFRRTSIKDRVFTCKFNQDCVVDNNTRSCCKYCRYQKCIEVGMNRNLICPFREESESATPTLAGAVVGGIEYGNEDSVLDERDLTSDLILRSLLEMESRVNEVMITHYWATTMSSTSPEKCRTEDLDHISRVTLLLIVEWAKTISPFPDLMIEDKMILLKNYAPQHLILMPAFRNPSNFQSCFDGPFKGKESMSILGASKTSNVASRAFNELVLPMSQLRMSDEEFVCFKAFIFLQSDTTGLSFPAKQMIRESRNRMLKVLRSHILKRNSENSHIRYANILLLAPILKYLTHLLVENITLSTFFGLPNVETLLSDYILSDDQSRFSSSSSRPTTSQPAPSSSRNTVFTNETSSEGPTSATFAAPAATSFPYVIPVVTLSDDERENDFGS